MAIIIESEISQSRSFLNYICATESIGVTLYIIIYPNNPRIGLVSFGGLCRIAWSYRAPCGLNITMMHRVTS